jgi:hypothetical protein
MGRAFPKSRINTGQIADTGVIGTDGSASGKPSSSTVDFRATHSLSTI